MKITGKGGISAEIIADSVMGISRITTFELEYPRFIHAEFMTHRQFSRNAASSRAIPIDRMHQQVKTNMAMPVHWGRNQAGMSAKEEVCDAERKSAIMNWQVACDMAVHNSRMLSLDNVHKQIANRVTEPFQMMKVVVTATEWANWYWLRNHGDAQPEIHELAEIMLQAHEYSQPDELVPGEWHLPYVKWHRNVEDNRQCFTDSEFKPLTLDEARAVSASCCAQVSYRKNDDSLEKALMIFDKLINSEPVHASPIEHQASPMVNATTYMSDNVWESGVTHCDRAGNLWSGNFKHWIQFRQLIPNNAK